uniref:Uncharacterized protein n=1 Tax=Arundo donax TaxID=35708 RepID=A0A0A9FAY8_ARUDO
MLSINHSSTKPNQYAQCLQKFRYTWCWVLVESLDKENNSKQLE